MSPEGAPSLWCEFAWLGGERADAGVLIELDGERISSLTTGVASPPTEASSLVGLTIPGLANAHSHAFHRADWDAKLDTRIVMTCDKTHFHLHSDVDAYADGARIFSRSFQHKIARDHL